MKRCTISGEKRTLTTKIYDREKMSADKRINNEKFQGSGERERERVSERKRNVKCENWKRENVKNEMRFNESVLLS